MSDKILAVIYSMAGLVAVLGIIGISIYGCQRAGDLYLRCTENLHRERWHLGADRRLECRMRRREEALTELLLKAAKQFLPSEAIVSRAIVVLLIAWCVGVVVLLGKLVLYVLAA